MQRATRLRADSRGVNPRPFSRRNFLKGLGAAGLGLTASDLLAACGSSSTSVATQSGHAGTLTIAMTAAQIPGLDAGTYENQGWEGERFVAFQLYDGLTRMVLDRDATPTPVQPALAESWKASPDATRWTFKLRPGVKFHDGTPWNADAAVFGLRRLTDKSAPQYNATDASSLGLYSASIASVRKLNDMTIEIRTNGPYALLPDDLPFLAFPSPTAVSKLGAKYANAPVGTGPFKFVEQVLGDHLTLARNESYWRGPAKVAKLVLKPISDPNARVNALLSGAVDWAEYPTPNDVALLKGKGFQIFENPYSHIWPWIFDMKKVSDPRVRLAMNLAIDRETLAQSVLRGTGVPAYQYIPAADPGFSESNAKYSYDPKRAKTLLQQAGHGSGMTMSVAYPTSGSGNMEPPSMNQALQADLAKVGVKVKLEPIEWTRMVTDFGADKISYGADADNLSYGFWPPINWEQTFHTRTATDGFENIQNYSSPEFNALAKQLRTTLDPQRYVKIVRRMNALLVRDSPWMVVVSDNNPRALAPHVHGFVQPKAVWLDLTKVSVT